MVDKKVYIVLLIIIIVFFVLMFSIFGIENIKQDNYQSTIIVGDDSLWTYSGREWISLGRSLESEKYNWQEYKVFEDSEELGNFTMWRDDKWYAFDDEKNAVPINGKLFAYSANYKMNVINFIEKNTTDMTYVKKVLKNNYLDEDSLLTSNYHITFDFDSDGVDEDFYIVSNAFPLDFEPNSVFSLAFMVKNDTIYEFYKNVKSGNSLDICKPYYHTVVDTNSDGVYEFILSCGNYSTNGTINMLYKFIDDEFKIVVSNQ